MPPPRLCLVTAMVFRHDQRQLGEFLYSYDLFGVVLALDDKFEGHEAVMAGILGVPEPLTFAV